MPNSRIEKAVSTLKLECGLSQKKLVEELKRIGFRTSEASLSKMIHRPMMNPRNIDRFAQALDSLLLERRYIFDEQEQQYTAPLSESKQGDKRRIFDNTVWYPMSFS